MRERIGIVLAAGEGRRMGGAKALMLASGRTLTELHACTLHSVSCNTIAIVVRPADAHEVERLFVTTRSELRARLRIIVASTRTQAESLAVALDYLAIEERPNAHIVITPVDMLPVATTTLDALLGAVERGAVAATPVFRGRGGHPVVVRAELLGTYASAKSSPPLDRVLTEAGERRVRMTVDDPTILADYDVPTDLPEPPRFLRSGLL